MMEECSAGSDLMMMNKSADDSIEEEEEEEEETVKIYAIYSSHTDTFIGRDFLYALPVKVSASPQVHKVKPILYLGPPNFPLYMGYACVGPYIYMLGGSLAHHTSLNPDVLILDTQRLPDITKGPQLNDPEVFQPYVHVVRGKLFMIPDVFGPDAPKAEFLRLCPTSSLPLPGEQWQTIPCPTKIDLPKFFFHGNKPHEGSYEMLACNVIGSFIMVSVNAYVLYMLDADRPRDGWKKILSSLCILNHGIGARKGLHSAAGLLVSRTSLPLFIAWDLKQLESHLWENNDELDDDSIIHLFADVSGSEQLAGNVIKFGVRRVLDMGGGGMALILSYGSNEYDGDLCFIVDVVRVEKKAPPSSKSQPTARLSIDLDLVSSSTYVVDPAVSHLGCLQNAFLVRTVGCQASGAGVDSTPPPIL